MKKVLKRSLSVLLAITIIFSSAYVGINELDVSKIEFDENKFDGIDFNGVSQFLKAITPDFSVKSQAASSGTCGDNLTWSLDDEGTLTISGTGDMTDYSSAPSVPWYSVNSSITTVVIDSGVTSIGDFAFKDCINLASVTIGDKVTSIGYGAFYNCSSLTSVVIPDSVTRIVSGAFRNCTSLTTITIPDSVTEITGSAFGNTAYYNDSNNWENDVFYIDNHLIEAKTCISGNFEIKDGTKTIASNAFEECTSLTSIMIPDSVTSICGYAFRNCTSLTSITIPDSVLSIGIYAFTNTAYYNDNNNWENCVLYIGKHLIKADESLSDDYEIKSGTKSISSSAFCNCTSLTSVTIPATVIGIGKGIFAGCTSFTGVITPCNSYASTYFDETNLRLIHTPADQWIIDVSPTCVDAGSQSHHCTVCDAKIDVMTLDALGHSYVDGVCNSCGNGASTVEGSDLFSVKAVGFENKITYTVYLNAGVSFSGAIVYAKFDTEVLSIDKSVSGAYMIDDSDIGEIKNIDGLYVSDFMAGYDDQFSIAHAYGQDVDYKAGTSNEPYMNFTFNITNENVPEPFVEFYCYEFNSKFAPENNIENGANVLISSLSNIHYHSFSDWITEKESTCTENGNRYKICNTCDTRIDEELLAGHNFVDGVCTICKKIDGRKYLTFNLNSDKTTYSVSECDVTVSGELVIPDTYNGKPVTRIGSNAFEYCIKLTSIIIPNSITEIGYCAFSECFKLISFTIPDSVTTIHSGAFQYCKTLSNIVIPNSVTSIGESLFEGCYNLKSVIIGDGVTSIPYKTFEGCSNLASITIGNNVKSLSDCSFSYTKLTSITIPASVSSIDDDAFNDCMKLTAINVDENNINYFSLDGVLYNKDKTTLIRYPEGKSDQAFVIPDSVRTIGRYAFFNCVNLVSITIPDSVLIIEKYAFDAYDFDEYEDLKYIFYTGSENDWNDIVIYGESSLDCSSSLWSAIVHYNSIGHSYSDWVIVEEATEDSVGKKQKGCTVCGEVLEVAEIPQLKCSKPKLKTIANTEYGVKIAWGKVSGADTYRVYRKTKSGSWKYLGSTSKTGYTDKTAKSGTKYYYAVRARNEAGNSSLSSSLSKYYLEDSTLKTPSSTSKGIGLRWSKVAGAQGYMVYRKEAGGSYKRIATEKGVSNLTFRDTSAEKGTKYYYKVKAYYSKTYSAYSNTKSVTDKY